MAHLNDSMAQKRTAREAFDEPKGQLSAFAAAKFARQNGTSIPADGGRGQNLAPNEDLSALAAGSQPDSAKDISLTTLLDASAETALPKPPKPEPVLLSTFGPNEGNTIWHDDERVELTLQYDETVTLVGEYDLSVASGVVTVYGAVLRADSSPRRIYAPSTHALPQIQARQDGTVIQVSSAKSGLRKLEKLSPLFRNIWTSDSPAGRSFAILGSSADDMLQRSLSVLNVDRDTDAVLRTVSARAVAEPRRPRVMAIGAKASGKSTLNRILCNHLLSWTPLEKCQYLDIDPGQPEFGPSGQLSLVETSQPVLGPPFTHPASFMSTQYKLIRSHTIAATSFKDDPEYYRACVRDLAQHTDRRYPLIINSCGWVVGLGASVLANLVEDLDISDVILMEPLEATFIESIQRDNNGASVYRIPREPSRPSPRTPAEHRAMQTMAYFHSRLDIIENLSSLRWSSKPISRIRSWIVDYTTAKPGLWAILSYNQTPNPQFLSEVLDGSVVALATVEEEEAAHLADHIGATPEGIPYISADDQGISRTLDPIHSQIIGLALVRAIDTENKQLHLLTPLEESQVATTMAGEKKVALVRGGFDPPEWAYLEDLYKDDDASSTTTSQTERPWVSKKGLVGVEGAVWRLRHPPMLNTAATGR